MSRILETGIEVYDWNTDSTKAFVTGTSGDNADNNKSNMQIINDKLVENGNQISILSTERGYVTRKAITDFERDIVSNGKYIIGTTGVGMAFGGYSWTIDATFENANNGAVRATTYYGGGRKGETWENVKYSGAWQGWIKLVTQDEMNVLNDQALVSSGELIDDLNLFYGQKVFLTKIGCLNLPNSSFRYLVNVYTVAGFTYQRATIMMTSSGNYTNVITTYERHNKTNSSATSWTSWKEIATTDKVDILFPYNTGFKDEDSSWKSFIENTQLFTRVVINTAHTTGTFPKGALQIATLPVGSRPSKNLVFILGTNDAQKYCKGVVYTSGVVAINNVHDGVSYVEGNVVF